MTWDRLEGQSHEHSHRTSVLAVGLASHMGLPEEQCMHIRHGALLHEIGTLVIPDSIMRKPAKLGDDLCLVVRTHPTRGYALSKPIGIKSKALEIPLYHPRAVGWRRLPVPAGGAGNPPGGPDLRCCRCLG